MRFYHRFVNETLDSNGTLKTFEPKLPDNYNFGYDVVDAIASETPDKLAMVWCNAFGDDKQFTFSDISRLSTKTANVFSKYGIKKEIKYSFCSSGITNTGTPSSHSISSAQSPYLRYTLFLKRT